MIFVQLFHQLYFSFINLLLILKTFYLDDPASFSNFGFCHDIKMSMIKNNVLKGHKRNEIDVSVFSNIFYTKLLENIIDLKKGAKRQS